MSVDGEVKDGFDDDDVARATRIPDYFLKPGFIYLMNDDLKNSS